MPTQLFEFKTKEENSHPTTAFVQLSNTVLLRNGKWFIKLRWLAIAILIALPVLSKTVPSLYKAIGLIIPETEFLYIGIGLLGLNSLLAFLYKFRIDDSNKSLFSPYNMIWVQIIMDLTFITYVVYLSGSTNTPVALLYTLHIALACIFLSTFSSLKVTIAASFLFALCVLLEQFEFLPYRTVYSTYIMPNNHFLNYISAISTIAIIFAL